MKRKQFSRTQVLKVSGAFNVAELESDGGRQIPLILVASDESPLIREVMRIHQHFSVGDCKTQWVQPTDDRSVLHLHIDFLRPLETEILFEFTLSKFAEVIDRMIRVECLYFTEGKEGDSYLNTLDRPRIRVDLPATGFEPTWEKMLLRVVSGRFRERGKNRKESKALANAYIKKTRTMASAELN